MCGGPLTPAAAPSPDASAAKRQAAEEAAKASKNKERLQQMFAKAAGEGHHLAHASIEQQ
jgi:hypothetical protein